MLHVPGPRVYMWSLHACEWEQACTPTALLWLPPQQRTPHDWVDRTCSVPLARVEGYALDDVVVIVQLLQEHDLPKGSLHRNTGTDSRGWDWGALSRDINTGLNVALLESRPANGECQRVQQMATQLNVQKGKRCTQLFYVATSRLLDQRNPSW